ncbi:hypothetical protein DDB_G0280281 [Dictyostelium discoideum AX4]|uniref:Uncharacterized protein n=1 Tax=Dictyostelium discoideum TaxID=44689 RepID=Q54VK5_DICDI|nr:hypothetical protein DDB_G0280281 [Dictyostelium discoideum AX4]EAL67367.1 hypothetical protein DDB_G0280281 [Dictyostelium discoideum AX4]|eukprot:XP_641350.1 hypothetical protein DDB_G0280281 [Dictyostelium discoideum AX4]
MSDKEIEDNEFENEEEEVEEEEEEEEENAIFTNEEEEEEKKDIMDEIKDRFKEANFDEFDETEIINNGKELIKQSNILLEEIKELESGKELYQHSKQLVDTVLKKQEAKELMEKGLNILTEVKQNQEAQALIGECKNFIDLFSKEDKVQSIIQQGKELLEGMKDENGEFNLTSTKASLNREAIESLFAQGSTIFKEFNENDQNSLYLDKMKKLFFDLKEAESTRITLLNGIAEGKKWVESLKEKDPQIKSLVDEGEQIFNQIASNPEVSSLFNDSKKVFENLLTSETKLDPSSPEFKVLIERGEKIAGDLKEQLKSNKLVGEVTQREDVKIFLEKGNKFISEVKSKEQLIDFLKQNKDFIKEIKNTIVPFITDQLLKVQIPTVNGITKGFKYELSNLVFAGLNIPPEGVDVEFSETNSITASVSGFTAQLKNFSWSYKQEGFPYLKDQGLASANCQKGFTSLTFDIETNKETNTPEIKITNIVFKIENLEVLVQESGKVKWLYNYLISKFSESIKEVVENKIKGTITGHINTLSTKINQIVGQYWNKLIDKIKSPSSNSTLNSPSQSENKITELNNENNENNNNNNNNDEDSEKKECKNKSDEKEEIKVVS